MEKKDIYLIKIGKKIKQLRVQKGISQEKLAFISNLNPKYVGDIERGEHNPSALVLIRIAKSLATEVGDFFPRINS